MMDNERAATDSRAALNVRLAWDEATLAIERFVEAYDEFQKRTAIDRSIGGLRVVAQQKLDALRQSQAPDAQEAGNE